jgi:hypothetical protein
MRPFVVPCLLAALLSLLSACVRHHAVEQFSTSYQCPNAHSRELEDIDFYEVTGCGRRAVYFCSDNGYSASCTERESIAIADTASGGEADAIR